MMIRAPVTKTKTIIGLYSKFVTCNSISLHVHVPVLLASVVHRLASLQWLAVTKSKVSGDADVTCGRCNFQEITRSNKVAIKKFF